MTGKYSNLLILFDVRYIKFYLTGIKQDNEHLASSCFLFLTFLLVEMVNLVLKNMNVKKCENHFLLLEY